MSAAGSVVAFCVALVALTACFALVVGALLIIVRALPGGEWVEDPPCANPTCRHEAWEHQQETEDGACAMVGCPCKALEREDHSWSE